MKGSNYISIGYNFLQLTINSIEEMSKQKNKSIIAIDGNLSDEKAWEIYDNQTSWNDQNVGIPILFNFFHGVELILKGLIIKCDGDLIRNHKLTELVKLLEKCPNKPESNVIELMHRIVKKNGFESFFEINNLKVDSYYELFKYPELKNQTDIKFGQIRNQEQNGLNRFLIIKELATLIKIEIKIWLQHSTANNI